MIHKCQIAQIHRTVMKMLQDNPGGVPLMMVQLSIMAILSMDAQENAAIIMAGMSGAGMVSLDEEGSVLHQGEKWNLFVEGYETALKEDAEDEEGRAVREQIEALLRSLDKPTL